MLLLSPASDRSATNPSPEPEDAQPDAPDAPDAADAADAAAQANQAAQADGADGAEAEAEAEPASQEHDHQDQSQDAPSQDGQAAVAQGGGAAASVVSGSGSGAGRRRAPRRVFKPTVVDDRLVKITIEERGKPNVELERPENGNRSDPMFALWKYADEQRKLAADAAFHARTLAAVRDLVDKGVNRHEMPRRGASPQLPSQLPSRAAGAAMTVFNEPLPPPRPPLHEQLPAHLQPVPVGVLGNGNGVDPGARWQVKPLDHALAAEIEAKWFLEITEDTSDLSGREFVPSGLKNASFCGSFPHAVCRPKLGPHREKTLYLIGATHDTRLKVSLRRRPNGVDDFPEPVSESEVLALLRQRLPAAEVANWGSFESSIVLYVELQFDQSVADAPAARIDTNPRSPQCAFKTAPENGKLLMPPESPPYAGGYYEQQMANGCVCFQFKPNVNVTTSNLSEPFHNQRFRYAVWCLNPYLNGLSSFQAMSLSFAIKSSLHNDLKRAERYVHSSGPGSEIIPCPLDQIPSTAAPNRRKRKMAVMALPDAPAAAPAAAPAPAAPAPAAAGAG